MGRATMSAFAKKVRCLAFAAKFRFPPEVTETGNKATRTFIRCAANGRLRPTRPGHTLQATADSSAEGAYGLERQLLHSRFDLATRIALRPRAALGRKHPAEEIRESAACGRLRPLATSELKSNNTTDFRLSLALITGKLDPTREDHAGLCVVSWPS